MSSKALVVNGLLQHALDQQRDADENQKEHQQAGDQYAENGDEEVRDNVIQRVPKSHRLHVDHGAPHAGEVSG